MIEKKIINKSLFVFIIGCLIITGISIFIGMYTLLLGFILGYIFDLLSFIVTIKFTDMILFVQMKSSKLSGLMFLIKLSLYGLGFFIASKLPNIFHIATVFIGYMITKVTIYITMLTSERGE